MLACPVTVLGSGAAVLSATRMGQPSSQPTMCVAFAIDEQHSYEPWINHPYNDNSGNDTILAISQYIQHRPNGSPRKHRSILGISRARFLFPNTKQTRAKTPTFFSSSNSQKRHKTTPQPGSRPARPSAHLYLPHSHPASPNRLRPKSLDRQRLPLKLRSSLVSLLHCPYALAG